MVQADCGPSRQENIDTPAAIRPVRAAGNKVPLFLRAISHEGRADSRFISKRHV
jgi:hypothetical protein